MTSLSRQRSHQENAPDCAAGFAGALSTPGAGGSCRELALRAQTGDTTIPAVAVLRSAAQKGRGTQARLRPRPPGGRFVGRVSTRHRYSFTGHWRVETRPTPPLSFPLLPAGTPFPSVVPSAASAGRKKAASLSEPAGRVCEAARPVLAEGGEPEGPRQWGVLLCLSFLHKQESRSPAGARPGQRPPPEAHKTILSIALTS